MSEMKWCCMASRDTKYCPECGKNLRDDRWHFQDYVTVIFGGVLFLFMVTCLSLGMTILAKNTIGAMFGHQ